MADISIQFAPSGNDGSVIVSLQHGSQHQEHRVEASALSHVRRAVAQLMEAFESHRRPWIDPVALAEVGRRLHTTFLEPLGGDLRSRAADGPLRLVFTSTEPDYLNLPWELLPGADGQFLVADARCTIRRSTRTSLDASILPRVAPPLRVLFAACAPIDQPGLDYEKEEEAILRIGHQLGAQVHLEFAEAGTFDKLRDLISQYQPHVVHLSGHGSVRDGIGSFAFENERGLSDPRDAHEMAQQLFAGNGVRLVFVNGCQTAQAAVAGVCQTLTVTCRWRSAGLPALPTIAPRTSPVSSSMSWPQAVPSMLPSPPRGVISSPVAGYDTGTWNCWMPASHCLSSTQRMVRRTWSIKACPLDRRSVPG